MDSNNRRVVATAGMASYLDAGALLTTGLSVGGFYAESMPLSPSTVGLLLGAQTLAFAVGASTGGRLGDRFGRRNVLLASLTLYAFGVGILSIAGGTASLAAGVVLAGFAIGGDLPSSLALISESVPPSQMGRAVAISHVLWGAGTATTGLMAFSLAEMGALAARVLYLHLLVVAVVVLLLRLHLRESTEWRTARHLADAAPAADSLVGASHHREGFVAVLRGPVAPAAIALCLYFSLWTLAANTLGQFTPYLWIQVMGGSPRGAAALLLVLLPLVLVGAVLFVRVVGTPGRRNWVAGGSVLSCAGWAAFVIHPTQELYVVLLVTFVLGASVSGEAVYKVWTQEMMPTLVRATAQGATLATGRVLAALVGVLTPTLAQGDVRVLFGALLLANIAATAIAVWWIPHLQRRSLVGVP